MIALLSYGCSGSRAVSKSLERGLEQSSEQKTCHRVFGISFEGFISFKITKGNFADFIKYLVSSRTLQTTEKMIKIFAPSIDIANSIIKLENKLKILSNKGKELLISLIKNKEPLTEKHSYDIEFSDLLLSFVLTFLTEDLRVDQMLIDCPTEWVERGLVNDLKEYASGLELLKKITSELDSLRNKIEEYEHRLNIDFENLKDYYIEYVCLNQDLINLKNCTPSGQHKFCSFSSSSNDDLHSNSEKNRDYTIIKNLAKSVTDIFNESDPGSTYSLILVPFEDRTLSHNVSGYEVEYTNAERILNHQEYQEQSLEKLFASLWIELKKTDDEVVQKNKLVEAIKPKLNECEKILDQGFFLIRVTKKGGFDDSAL